ncbi:hypothetical protein WCLP8_3000002 [uncultured Gammaproteobacteria bacterium]
MALGHDRVARSGIARQILDRRHRLYHDDEPIRALEGFLTGALGRG